MHGWSHLQDVEKVYASRYAYNNTKHLGERDEVTKDKKCHTYYFHFQRTCLKLDTWKYIQKGYFENSLNKHFLLHSDEHCTVFVFVAVSSGIICYV